MKFTLNWLKEYLDTDASLERLSETLTMIGLEVEQITDRSAELSAFKVAQILDAKPHPDADKLQICTVNTGAEKLQIVCGAPNARAGINVVLAPVGTIIPTNGMKIKESKIRGIQSNGMLCSAAELGLGEDHSGIIEMPACNDNVARGFAEVAGLNDPVIEIAITPNRGDCLGVYGIARDLAAAGLGTLKPLNVPSVSHGVTSPIAITTGDETLCPLFVGRYFKGVKNGQSPDWLVQKLEAIGLKPISALVDITNYIAYAFGRPLHVYDAVKLSGNLVARKASKGEKIAALDEKEYILDDDMLVIADDKGPQAIGGVIGGAASGCSEGTTEVLLEVALFDAINVAATGRKLDILTDSRYRFERNVDPAFVNDACAIASKMILDLCGGDASEPVIAGTEPAWQRTITFDFAKVKARAGIEVSDAQSKKILEDLGFKVQGNEIAVPPWRFDVQSDVDLVEEVVRIYGYDNIPSTPLPFSESERMAPAMTVTKQRLSKIRRTLASCGMSEAITWSFMSSGTATLFGGGSDALQLQNPISSEWDCMRPSILPNLIEAAGRNADRGHKDIALFESGLIYNDATPEGQIPTVAGIRVGNNAAKNMYAPVRNVDVFDAKADVYAALEAAGAPTDNLRITTDAPNWYHPGRSGVLRLGKAALAYFGEIHPATLKKLDVQGPVVGFEVFVQEVPAPKKKKSTARKKLEISEYQSSTRDFAFIVDEATPVQEIIRAVAGADKQLIENASLFDVYQGKGVEEGKKSIAISIHIQPKDHTLTEAELEAVSTKVIAAVEKTGGVLRG